MTEFIPITPGAIKVGRVYDIERPTGLFSFWHVTVLESPQFYLTPPSEWHIGESWLQFRVTDGLFAQSLRYHPALIREVVD